MFDDLENYQPGDVVSAKDMRTLGDVTRAVRGISGNNAFLDPTGAFFRKNGSKFETIWGRLSAVSSSRFEFIQVAPGTNGTFTDVTGGYSTVSGSSGSAISSQGTNTTLSPGGTSTTVVMLKRGIDPDTGQRVWAFEEPSPPSPGGGGDTVTFKITGLQAGHHQYTVQIVSQDPSMTAGNNVSSGYMIGGATNYTAINLQEMGSSVDWQLDPSRDDVYFTGRTNPVPLADGKIAIHFNGVQIGAPC